MFAFIVAVLNISMFLSATLFIPLLLIYRIVISINNKLKFKKMLLVVLIPFSFGYYYFLDDDKKSKGYNILVIILFSITLLGFMFTLFQIIMPGYN